MKRITKLFATFLSPGAFVAESWTRDLDSLDPGAVEWPDNAYAFTLHRREDVVDGDETFTGKAVQVGPTYYHPDSRIETLAEVRKNPKASRILVQNMECNNWPQIICNRWGNLPQPYDPAKDTVLP